MQTQPLEQYDVSPVKLWSLLQQQLSTCGLAKGSPQQWIGTIRNLQKKGVSAVEVDWSYITPMLEKCTESSLSIDELLDFLEYEPECELVLQRHITNEYLPVVHYEKQQRSAEMPPVAICRGRREVRLLHYLNRTFGLHIWLHVGFDNELFGRHNYWSLSVPRGQKKLSQQPVARSFTTAHEAMAYGRMLVARMARRLASEGFIGQMRNLNRFTRYALPGGEHYTEWLITAPNISNKYYGEHFEVGRQP